MGRHLNPRKPLTAGRRFQYRIWPRGDCWEWRGYKLPLGHGEWRMDDGKVYYAHRIAYEMAKGPIMDGFHIDHICGHPWCVRPSHLQAVRPNEHMLRHRTLERATHTSKWADD